MSCGCFGVPGSGTEYEKVKQDAKKRAQEENKTMAIWQEWCPESGDFRWYFGDAQQAISDKRPIREVLSKHQ
jgi:hypothetical protein